MISPKKFWKDILKIFFKLNFFLSVQSQKYKLIFLTADFPDNKSELGFYDLERFI